MATTHPAQQFVSTGPMARREKPQPWWRLDDTDLQYVFYAVAMSLATALFKEIVGTDSIIMIGSYNLTVVEPVMFLQVIALVKLMRRRVFISDLLTWLMLGMSVIYFMTVLRGIPDDMFTALRAVRGQGVFALYLIIATLVPRDERLMNAIRKALIVSAIALAALVLLRLLFGVRLFIRVAFDVDTEINDGGRPLSADGALMLGVGAVMLASLMIEGGKGVFQRYGLLLLPGLLFFLLFSAQATANLSSYVSLFVLVSLHPSPSRSSRLLLAIGTATLGMVAYSYLTGVFGRVNLSFLPEYFRLNLTKRTGTLEVRHLIWAGLMKDFVHWSTFEQFFGLRITDKPTIYMPRSGGYYWWVSIHSMYYGSLVFMGAVGLVMYIGTLLIIAFRGLSRAFGPARTWSSFGGAIPLALLAAFGLFGHSYELRDEHTVLILLAVMASRPILSAAGDAARRTARLGNTNAQLPLGSSSSPL